LSVLNVLATNNSVHLSIVGGLTLKTTMSWPCCNQSLPNQTGDHHAWQLLLCSDL